MMHNEGKASEQTGKYNEHIAGIVLVNMMVEANVQHMIHWRDKYKNALE
jgi:hypothetical protein